LTAGDRAAGKFSVVIERQRASHVLSALAVVLALAVAGCGGGSSTGTANKGLTTLVDGNVTCADRVQGSVGSGLRASAPSVTVDQARFAIDPAAGDPVAGQLVHASPLKGFYVWKAPAQLTAERNVFVVIDPKQTNDARLRFDPTDRKSGFAQLSQTTRFAACFDAQLQAEGKKPTPTTGFAGAIVTRARALCLRLRVVSERNNAAAALVLPLGRKCDGA
jgi:hypothetical protein